MKSLTEIDAGILAVNDIIYRICDRLLDLCQLTVTGICVNGVTLYNEVDGYTYFSLLDKNEYKLYALIDEPEKGLTVSRDLINDNIFKTINTFYVKDGIPEIFISMREICVEDIEIGEFISWNCDGSFFPVIDKVPSQDDANDIFLDLAGIREISVPHDTMVIAARLQKLGG